MEAQEQYLPLKIKSKGRFYGELVLGVLAVLFMLAGPMRGAFLQSGKSESTSGAFNHGTAKAEPTVVSASAVPPMLARPAEATARPLTVMEQIKVQCAVKWTSNGITDFRMVKYCIDKQVEAAQELGAL